MKNHTIRVLLVDDEINALDLMEGLLNSISEVEVVGKAANKIDAISMMLKHEPSVIFQDIQMQGINGLELVDEYRKYHFNGKVVFVTAHGQYAIDAIKKAAFDYLLKPVDLDDLNALILRLKSESIVQDLDESIRNPKLKIPTRTGYLLVPKDEIVFCEADGNYTKIVKSDTSYITTSLHLGKVEEDLDLQKFFRIDRSTIINLDFLISVNKGKKECQVKGAAEEYTLHISSKRISKLEQRI